MAGRREKPAIELADNAKIRAQLDKPPTAEDKQSIRLAAAAIVAALSTEGHTDAKCELDGKEEHVLAETTFNGFTARVKLRTSDPSTKAYIESGKLAIQLRGQTIRYGKKG